MTDAECQELLRNPGAKLTNGQKNELLAYSRRIRDAANPPAPKTPEQFEAEHRERVRKLNRCKECNSHDIEFQSVPADGVNGSVPGKYYSAVCKDCGNSLGRIFSTDDSEGEEAALRKWNNHN